MLQVTVHPEAINEVKQTFIPPNHPVFTLVPFSFEREVTRIYDDLGHPALNSDVIWGVYLKIYEQLQVEITTEIIPFATVKSWSDGVVCNATDDDKLIVEAQDIQPATEVYDIDGPVPEGFTMAEEGSPMQAEWTDDEGEGDGDEWVPAEDSK
jgi:hypothetical protein